MVKILIIKPSSLGDIVHSLPFLNAVKDAFPDAEIHWVIAKGLEGLLENHPMLNKLWIINKDHWKNLKKIKNTISEIRYLLKELRNEKYDMVIDLQGLMRSGLLTYATHAPVRIGFKEAREGSNLFYSDKIKGGREIHAVDRYLKIASAIGCEITDIRFPMPLVKESEKVRKLRDDIGDYAVIVPGARWKTKRWLPERFGALASMLDIRTVIVGSRDDVDIAQEIEHRVKSLELGVKNLDIHSTFNSKLKTQNSKLLNMAGNTNIKELISIIRNAEYVVSNDSGPMHIAAAFSIPVIAIFGPTNPVRTGPYGKNNIIVKSDIECAPCYKKNCKNMQCMDDISAERVYEAIGGL